MSKSLLLLDLPNTPSSVAYTVRSTLKELVRCDVSLLVSNIHFPSLFRSHSQWKGQGYLCTQHGANRYCRQGRPVEGVLRQQDEDLQEARHLHHRVCPWYLVTLPRCSPQDLKRPSLIILRLPLFLFPPFFSCSSYLPSCA